MTDFYTLVCQTAAKLQAEGKTPSLALVRANAGKGLDAAALFSAYQQWRSNPPVQLAVQHHAPSTTAAAGFTAAESLTDNEISALRDEVAQLRHKVEQLAQVVEQINVQLSTSNVRR